MGRTGNSPRPLRHGQKQVEDEWPVGGARQRKLEHAVQAIAGGLVKGALAREGDMLLRVVRERLVEHDFGGRSAAAGDQQARQATDRAQTE